MPDAAADPPAARRMSLRAALELLVELRGDGDVVVTTMGAAREWPKISRHPLDFHYVPSTMGGGIPLALGLAMAQPHRPVMVVSGDGSLLMSLGALVTVVDSGAANLTVVLIDNGVYEVTGGQRTAAAGTDFASTDFASTDFGNLARACGFPNVTQFWDLEDLRRRASDVLRRPGPRLMWMMVRPVSEDYTLTPPGPMAERLPRFRQALQRS